MCALGKQGESFYNSRIPSVVKELHDKGMIEDSDGAQIVRCGKSFPLMAVKRDGGYGYDSTDLAAVRYRIKEMGADRVVYVTDAGQGEHFEMVSRMPTTCDRPWWAQNAFGGSGVEKGLRPCPL